MLRWFCMFQRRTKKKRLNKITMNSSIQVNLRVVLHKKSNALQNGVWAWDLESDRRGGCFDWFPMRWSSSQYVCTWVTCQTSLFTKRQTRLSTYWSAITSKINISTSICFLWRVNYLYEKLFFSQEWQTHGTEMQCSKKCETNMKKMTHNLRIVAKTSLFQVDALLHVLLHL